MPEPIQRAFTRETDPRLAHYQNQLAIVQDDLRRARSNVERLAGIEKNILTNIEGVALEYDEHPLCKHCGKRWIAHSGHNGQPLFRPRELGRCYGEAHTYYEAV